MSQEFVTPTLEDVSWGTHEVPLLEAPEGHEVDLLEREDDEDVDEVDFDGQLDPHCKSLQKYIRSLWKTCKEAATELDFYASCNLSSSRHEDGTLKFLWYDDNYKEQNVPSDEAKVSLERFQKVSMTGSYQYVTQLEGLLEIYTTKYWEDYGNFDVGDGLSFSELTLRALHDYHDYAYMMDLWMTWAELQWIIKQDDIWPSTSNMLTISPFTLRTKTFKKLRSRFQEQYTHLKSLGGYEFQGIEKGNDTRLYIRRKLSFLMDWKVFKKLETDIGENRDGRNNFDNLFGGF